MRRISELDALRGIAAVSIVLYHLWFPKITILGTGVDLFFVMSGYLITAIILRQREQPGFLVTFYARRSLRIWPIYYLSLLFLVAISSALPRPFPTQGLPYYLTYTQNLPQYWGAENPPFIQCFTHTWSLAVEEQYYLFWPLAVVLLGKRSLIPLAVGLMGLAIGTRMVGFSKWIMMTHLDGLALGGVLAAVLRPEATPRLTPKVLQRWLVGVGIAAILFLARGNAWIAGLGQSWSFFRTPEAALSLRLFAINVVYFSLIGLVVMQTGHRWLAPLRDRRLALLGQMSYGIYLYHYFLFEIVQQYAEAFGWTNWMVIDGVKLVASFTIAWASWHLIEQPLLSLKDRFAYRSHAFAATKSKSERAGLEPLQSGAQ